MNELFRRMYAISVKAAASGDPRAFDVIASTDDVDMVGEVLAQDWSLARYAQNPVVLYMHNFAAETAAESLPIGFGSEVGVVDGKLKATIHYVDAAASELAALCYQGMKQGSLRAISVGFRSKLGRLEERSGQDVYVLSGNELIEISVCPIGINPNAVAAAAKALGLPDERESLRALVKASDPSHPPARGQHVTSHEEIPMKIVAKALNLKEDASEAEVLNAVNAVLHGSKALETRVLEATATKSIDEAIGVIKAGFAATEQLATTRAALAIATVDVEKRDRDTLVAKGVAENKLTPALVEWATAQVDDGKGGKSYAVSLATLTGFLGKAAPHPVLAASPVARPGELPPPAAGAKAWEAMTPAEKHELSTEAPEQFKAAKADWERRGKPAMTYPKLGSKSAA